MPKKIFKQVKLPMQQPDRCMDCPLLGMIPAVEREFGSQETLVCLATHHAMNARIARSKASEHTAKHPLKRWCDDDWERWQQEPMYGNFPIRITDYGRYRDLFVRECMEFQIIFHSKRGPKPKR